MIALIYQMLEFNLSIKSLNSLTKLEINLCYSVWKITRRSIFRTLCLVLKKFFSYTTVFI